MLLAREHVWLALRLTHLPLEVLAPTSAAGSPRLIIEQRRVRQVICCDEAAAAAGIGFGMDCTRAQILCDCSVQTRDRELERQALTRLCEGLYQFTPHLERYHCEPIAQTGVLLELSSCLRLFGGIDSLCQRIFKHVRAEGHRLAYGLAPTATGAWLLSFAAPEQPYDYSRPRAFERLKALPIELLYEQPNAVEALLQMGFMTLGDLAQQLGSQGLRGFRKRLGAEFVATLAAVFGNTPGLPQQHLLAPPRPSFEPHQPYRKQLELEFPIRELELLRYPIELCLQHLGDYLRRRQLECQAVVWVLRDIHRHQLQFTVSCDAAQSDWQLLYDLTLIQLERQALSFEVDTLELSCPQPMPRRAAALALRFDSGRRRHGERGELEITLAKLRARLGEQAIYKLNYRDSHIPEAATVKAPVAALTAVQLPPTLANAVRPVWLLARPEPLEPHPQGLYWRGLLKLLVGPERIHLDWWEQPGARDYFLAARDDGARLWVYQDLHTSAWFVHGLFG